MNDKFQKIKNTINRGVTTISVRTSSSIEKSKINVHIDTLNNEINAETAAAGSKAYEIWASGSTDFSELYEKFELIKQKKEEIERLNEELKEIDLRDSRILGTQQKEEVNAAPVLTCPECGSVYYETANFCRKCGHKF